MVALMVLVDGVPCGNCNGSIQFKCSASLALVVLVDRIVHGTVTVASCLYANDAKHLNQMQPLRSPYD